MIRLLVPHAVSGAVRIDGERLHYLARVLRLRSGDVLEVFDGKGQRFDARVHSLNEKVATLELENPRGEPALREVLIVQGLPKGDKLELVLQKGTELGASAFLPVGCERSVVKLKDEDVLPHANSSRGRGERWQRIVDEAARQSGRADVPVVHPAAPLIKGVEAFCESHALLVLDEEERAVPLSQALGALRADRPLALIIGPEGGLARGEIDQLTRLGARPVTLGRLVLRTETAALAALSVVRHLDGVLG